MAFGLKLLVSALVISFASWLAGNKPNLAGFIMALPISSLIAIAFTQVEWRDADKSAEFARSILVSIPLSLTFFLPFLFAKQIKLPFWGLYASGLVLLIISFGIHRLIFSQHA